MASYILSLPRETRKYVEPNSIVDMQSIAFLTYGRAVNFQFLKPDTVITEPAVIVPMSYSPTPPSRISVGDFPVHTRCK